MHRCLIVGLALLAGCSALPLFAQERDDDIILVQSAALGGKPHDQSGSSISVLDAPAIDSLGNSAASDLLRLIPSISVATAGPIGTQTQIRIRGAEANHTLVYIDGIKANDPAASSEYGFSELMSSGIDRIEIVRGPQSALYGSEAIGGVVSIFTRSPFDRKLYADASGGSFGTVQVNAGASTGGERIAASLNGGFHRTDGINISPAGNEKDGSRSVTVQARLEARPSDAGKLGLVARFVDQHSDYDDTQFFDPSIPYVVDKAGLQQRSRRIYTRGYAEISSSSWSHLLEASWVTTRNAQRTGVASDDTDVDGNRLLLSGRSGVKLAQGDWTGGVTFAVSHEREGYHDRSAAFGGFSNQRVSRLQTSLVGQASLAFAGRLFLDGSVRRDWNSGFADATTWRASAAVMLGAGFRLHGSAGRGVTNPTFTEQFGFFPGSFAGNPALKPEHSSGWDAGIEWRQGGLRVDVTGFGARLKNEISTGFDPDTFVATPFNESGTSHRKGVEISAEAKLGQFAASAFYTYLDATEPGDAANKQQQELRRPRHSGAITLIWDDGERLSAAASLSYTGARLDQDFRSFPAPRVRLDAYTLATFSAAYRLTSKLSFTGRIDNAFDARYQDVFGYRTSGIGFRVGLKWRD